MPRSSTDSAFKAPSDRVGRTIETTWKRVLEIAQNHVEGYRTSQDTSRTANSDAYERERQMISALDGLFTLVYEGKYYKHLF